MADIKDLRRRNVRKPLGAPPVHPDDVEPSDTSASTSMTAQDPILGASPNQTEKPSAPGTFSEDDLDIRPDVNARISRIVRDGIEYAHKHQGTVQGETMLDDTIYQMRLMGLTTREIAQRLNGSVTEEEVARRIGMMLARMDELSPAEYRQLQLGRLDALINFCWTRAKGGSADHIELILKTVERMNKMLDLETDKSRIEIELVTSHQATLLMSLVGGVLQVILGDPRVLQALSREEINNLAAKALDAAEHTIVDAQSQVLIPANDPRANNGRGAAKLVLSQRS